MAAYLLKRILLIIPTMLGVLTLTFLLAQLAPGGPVERMIAQLTGTDVSATQRTGGGAGDGLSGAARIGQPGQGADSVGSKYRGSQGLDPQFIRSAFSARADVNSATGNARNKATWIILSRCAAASFSSFPRLPAPARPR